MSLIEKIDAEIAEADTTHIGIFNALERDIWNNGYNNGIAYGLQKAKDIILSEQKEPLTIGDKIRESNESLAEFIKKYDTEFIDNYYCRHLCEHRINGFCELDECDRFSYDGTIDYLNQPYTDR